MIYKGKRKRAGGPAGSCRLEAASGAGAAGKRIFRWKQIFISGKGNAGKPGPFSFTTRGNRDQVEMSIH